MTDVYSVEKRSAVMRRVKGRDTTPEREVRAILRSLGVGYRLNRADLPGKPDIVMAGRRLAVFVHGCFWHGHDCRRGARAPKANAEYWSAKIGRNRARDARVLAELGALGWRAEVVWECELADAETLTRRLATVAGVQATAASGSDASSDAAAERTSVRAPSRAAGVRGLETK